ncbi:DnaJ-domain-containing protein [Ceraceosorus guamensis]|uniref:DnaJ-domain-containing protein n=1 Tax=Ceraceosorus guamensis TaxID=1522189 RepID=A0A316W9P2_9BASI|nr:DnaJ-domain-containing protein [Ceraceosorus guamensis]PWN44713.1 DnaJ-domain-containing protein [Ceraceosorus guamensis]
MPTADDPFAALGLPVGASEADIRAAYRKLSLKLHPDKARDVTPEVASARFHAIQTAYEALQDPVYRAKAASIAEAERKKNERRGAYDGNRKRMAEELEREEREGLKKRKDVKDREERLRRLKEEGKRLTEELLRSNASSSMPSTPDPKGAGGEASSEQVLEQREDEDGVEPALGPLDKTVKLRFPSHQQSLLAGSSASSASSESLRTPLASAMSRRFGKIEAIRFLPPKASKRHPERIPNEATALVSFAGLEDAMKAVDLGGQMNAANPNDEQTRILEDVHIGWATAGKGNDGEPPAARFRRSRRAREQAAPPRGANGQYARGESLPPPDGPTPEDAATYEANTLARLMSMS